MRRFHSCIFLVCVMLSQAAVGEEVYRSVDAEGNVTYTDTPPTGNRPVERVELPPGPSAESLRQTEQRNLEIRQAADKAQRLRLQQQERKAEQIKKAEQQLAEAEAKLAEAKVVKDEDRQKLVEGKRRIRADYFERVKQAEASVEAARNALKAARGH